MNKKKIYIKKLISLILASLTVGIIMSASAVEPFHSVYGFLYINDILVTSGVEVKLTFFETPEELIDNTDSDGYYQIDFMNHNWEEGFFYVNYEGQWYNPIENDSVQIISDEIGFEIDLHIYILNNPPDIPINPQPENNSVDINVNPTLNVFVTDPDDDMMNVSFFDASDDSLIDTAFNIANGSTTFVEWQDLSHNTTYFWYAVANDSEFETRSDTWQFKTIEQQINNPPEKPSNPSPENDSFDIDLNPTLSVTVIDIDNDTMDVSFYDASDNSLIDIILNADNNSIVSTIWYGLSLNTIYYWYAVANDSEFETRSDTWQFTTKSNNAPDKPTDPDPQNNQQDIRLNPTLSVLVNDPDNDLIDVAFYDASDDTLIGIDFKVESGSRATFEWMDLSYNTDYSWYTIADDSMDSTKSDTWSFKTVENQNPTVKIVKPERGLYILNRKILPRLIRPTLIIGKITIEAEANDDGSIEKVEFYINGKLKRTDEVEPYTYDWARDRLRLIHIFSIKVIAYDDMDATTTQQMIVRKFL